MTDAKGYVEDLIAMVERVKAGEGTLGEIFDGPFGSVMTIAERMSDSIADTIRSALRGEHWDVAIAECQKLLGLLR